MYFFGGRRKKFEVNNAESTYKVHYLGNVMTSLIKGGYCHGAPLNGNTPHQPNNNTPTSNNQFNDATNYKNLNQDFNFINTKTNKITLQLTDTTTKNETSTDDDDLDSNYSNYIYLNKNLNDRNLSSNNIKASVDKPVKILWDNHLKHNGQAGLKMQLTLTQGGLKVDTKDHGLTEYYGHRIHFIQAHPSHPKLFVWVYQHVGKNLKTEIRCHAALCQRVRDSKNIESSLNEKLQRTFLEYKREKRRQQNSRLCNTKNGGILTGQLGTRKRTFSITRTYKPPVQHGMCSAPKLDDVLEEEEEIYNEKNFQHRKNRLSLKKRKNVIVNEKEEMSIIDESEINSDGILKEHEDTEQTDEEEDRAQYNDNTNYANKGMNHVFDRVVDDDLAETINDEHEEEEIDFEIKNMQGNETDITSELDETCYYNTDNFGRLTSNSQLYDNRPMTQQLMLSSSSSSSISSNTTSPSQSHYSSSASSSNNEKPNIHQQQTQNQAEILVKRLNTLNLQTKSDNKNVLLNDSIASDYKEFTEVSYEFLGDLSKCNMDSQANRKRALTYSKSFTKNPLQTKPVNSVEMAASKDRGSGVGAFINPFFRSNFSRSFSAFTTRLKYQASMHENAKKQDMDDTIPQQSENSNKNFFYNLNNRDLVLINNDNIKNILSSSSSNSPLPSPTLSTCSNLSSSNSNSFSNEIIIELANAHHNISTI